MLTVVTWSWGGLFGPEYVNRLRAGLEKHLRLPHRLVLVADRLQPGLHPAIGCYPMHKRHADSPRCRRRMRHFSRDFAASIDATRILAIDLDVVLTGDITPIVERREPICVWRVGYAKVFSGSFVLFNAGALHGAWEAFDADPDGYPRQAQQGGVPSDQAMLNHYLRTRTLRDEMGDTGVLQDVGVWTEADGFVTYFGDGYERLAHLGVGPTSQTIPDGTRIVVLGSADKAVMDAGALPWIRTHWKELTP